MSAKKSDIEHEILFELRKGTNYTECLSVILGKFRVSDRTFDKYWKTANEKHTYELQELQKQLAEQNLEAQKELLKQGLKTKEDRIRVAEKIALGNGRMYRGSAIIPTCGDQLRALDYLSKLYGDYPAMKIQPLGGDGQPADASQNHTIIVVNGSPNNMPVTSEEDIVNPLESKKK